MVVQKLAQRFIKEPENYRLFQLYMIEKGLHGDATQETTDALGECMVNFIHIPGKKLPRSGIFTKFFKFCVAEYYNELRKKVQENFKKDNT